MKNSKKTIKFWLLSLIVLPLLGCYLFQLGDIVQTSYSKNLYQNQLAGLKDQQVALEEEATKIVSLAGIDNKIKELNFVPVQKIKYLSLNAKPLSLNANQELTLNK